MTTYIERDVIKGVKGQIIYIQGVCNGDKKGLGLANPFGYTIKEGEEMIIETIVTDENKYRHYQAMKDLKFMGF